MEPRRPVSVTELRARDLMVTDVVSIDRQAKISEALGLMTKHGFHELPILEEGALKGFLSFEMLAHRRRIPLTADVGSFMVSPPSVTESTTAPELAHAMVTNDFKALPVTRGERLVGILSRTDIVRAVGSVKEVDGVHAGDIMTPNPQLVRLDETAERARQLLQELDERGLPVVDENGVLAGYVEVMDLVGRMGREDSTRDNKSRGGQRGPVGLLIGSLLRPDVVAVPANEGLAKVVRSMAQHKAPIAVVTDRQKPIGLISSMDIMEWVAGFRPPEGVFVQITGLKADDPVVYDDIDRVVQRFLKHAAAHISPTGLTIHITERQKSAGEVVRYSVHIRLSSSGGFRTAAGEGWELLGTIADALDSLLGRSAKDHERVKGRRAAPRHVGR